MPPDALDLETCQVSSAEPSRRRILIVDDDHDQVELLEGGFRRVGYRTTGVYTGQAALVMARSRPDIIVLDVYLPDGNGLEICRRLSDDRRTCSIPVILLSGGGRPEMVRQARQAGCRYFLGKPYDPNALLTLVEAALAEPF